MIPKSLDYEDNNNIVMQNNNDTIDQLYQSIYTNIESIKKEYFIFLDPKVNNTTKKYIDNGLSENQSFSLSFMKTFILYLQISMTSV